jgi:hypothetical protein
MSTSLEVGIVVAFALVMGAIRYAILETEGPLHRLGDRIVTPDIPSRAKAVNKCVTSLFKGAYYLGAVVWGFSLLTPTSYLPHPLGGKGAGNTADAYLKGDGSLDVYYHMQLAFYVQDIAFQMQHYRRNDFTEMIIHHVCTISLILLSFYSDFTVRSVNGHVTMPFHGAPERVHRSHFILFCNVTTLQQMGAVILFLHDIADVPAHTTKAFVDTPYVSITLSR